MSKRQGDRKRLCIAHVVSELRPGGVEIRLLELMQHLGQEAENHIVLTVSGRKGPLAVEFENLGVRVIAQKMRALSYPARFGRTLALERPAVIQVYLNHTSGLQILLAWCFQVPIRITSFRSDGQNPASPYLRLRRRVLLSLIRRLSTNILGVSPSTLDLNMPGWDDDRRCRVIVNGFPERLECSRPVATLRSFFGDRSTSSPILAHVGRADIPSKNRERAILIAAKLNAMGRPHHLAFIGRHGATEEQSAINLRRWRRIADESGVADFVHFLGERRDVRQLLGDADCLLVTSTLEGLPGIIVESLLEDTPVVTSDIPGSRFLSQQLPGIRCVSLDASNEVWAENILGWRQACQEQACGRQLSQAVANSGFNIRRQVELLRSLWVTHEN